MLPDRISNPGPLAYESGALPIALRGLAYLFYFIVRRNVKEWKPNFAKIHVAVTSQSLS